MAEKTVCISQPQTKAIKIIKWKVREGVSISIGRILLLYDFDEVDKQEQRKLKSTQAGTVLRILAPEGAVIQPGCDLFEMIACCHPTIMNDMCAECGADLRKDDVTTTSTASVPMVHTIPDLKVSEELAQKLGRADSERLIKDRKLVLLVDLDQTLIHTTNDNIPPNIKDVYHFQLYGPNSPWYHTRLRPGTHQFLTEIFDYFELHICTFGARNYAHTIAMFLDNDERFFSNRILSRDECFDPNSKKANLKALFPCGDDMVCIIDDREDVWSHATNLIHVKPYHFFQHTGDINAPPGLDKAENDEVTGVDLTVLKSDGEIKLTNGCGTKEVNNTAAKVEETTLIQETNGGEENNKIEEEESVEAVKVEEEIEAVKVVEEDVQAVKVDEDNDSNNLVVVVEEEKEQYKAKTEEDKLIEIDDPDDYLIYLEDVLKRIHKAFYDEFDKLSSGEIPDLKNVIPYVRSHVLKGAKLVFSGLVPTHIKLHQSKAFQVARSLGADVTQDLEDDTTHLVAVRPGTAKVNAGRRKKNLQIVTPDWLWCCAERWELVDERIFPLNSKGSKNRHPPPHCSSPDHIPNYPEHEAPASRKRTPSGRFMDTINPLMSFSSADIADMDKEVEDILDDDDSDSSNSSGEEGVNKEKEESSGVSTGESSGGDEETLLKRKREPEDHEPGDGSDGDSVSCDAPPSAKLLCSNNTLVLLDESQESEEGSIEEAPDEQDDGEWNIMGAALEREFLSNE